MRHIRNIGLLMVAVAAFLSFAGTATAKVTNPPGTAYSGGWDLTSTNVSLHSGAGTIECKHSTYKGEISAGATSTVVSSRTFTECLPDTVNVLAAGSMTIASNGALTSTGFEITVVTHRLVFGFPVTAHCIWVTNNTPVGSLTEHVAAPAVTQLHISSSPIPRKVTDSACGETSTWTGNYTLTKPTGPITVD